jgi:cyclopropane-fatty-acyl-phospholipid synthase
MEAPYDPYLPTANYHAPIRPLSVLGGFFNGAKEAVIRLSPLTQVARAAVVTKLSRIQVGQLKILSPTNERLVFGQKDRHGSSLPDPAVVKAQIRIVKDSFWLRVLLSADLGFAESYMAGEIEVDDLEAVFKVRALLPVACG